LLLLLQVVFAFVVAFAFLVVIPAGNLLSVGIAPTFCEANPEGHGFNRAMKDRTKDLYHSAEGRSAGAAGTIELPSIAEPIP
jgi:hypothetical protein